MSTRGNCVLYQSFHEQKCSPKLPVNIASYMSPYSVIFLCACIASLGLSAMRALPRYQKTQFRKWQVMSLTLPPGWFDLGHQGELLSFRRAARTEDARRSKNFGSPAGKRREERATGKDIIALETSLHWFLCRKPVIPILFKSLGQQSHVLSSQFITPTLSQTLLQLREGVLLIETLLQHFLKRGKRFHKCFPLIYCCCHFPPDYFNSQPMWKIRRWFKIKWWWFRA